MRAIAEIAKRRTFAIISHPDAGKTTLTEKFLLYGGALQLAGSVKARRNQRATVSDWMELEKKRGISVSSTVLHFEYGGFSVNLLDTPGHNDFSEDTYRVLTAVDAAVMVVDAGKGIESQTRKLFEVCRRRKIPIFTFVNKLDRSAREPLSLMDEIEKVLGIHAFAVNWPVGSGNQFQGVYDRLDRKVHLFERTPGGAYRAPVETAGFADPFVVQQIPPETHKQVTEELEMLEGAGAPFDLEAVLDGELTPVFFGSALNNFGVQLLLDGFLSYAPPPAPRIARGGVVAPETEAFSGFIFKIQANMDPHHRDRLAFVRICSGQFTRGMTVTHARSGKKLRLAASHRLFGQDRDTVDEAFPGDIVGVVGHADFRVGDTLTEDTSIVFDEIPRFPSECFAFLHCPQPSMYKRFRAGVEQLLQEGVIQTFEMPDAALRVPLLGAVGPLQFEVVQYRLESEYGVQSRLEKCPWTVLRWVGPAPGATDLDDLILPTDSVKVLDAAGQPVVLFSSDWSERYFRTQNPRAIVSDRPLVNALDVGTSTGEK
ncbi:MAG: peptide chain release factor 3 [Planctomycetota bacterium]